MDPNQIVTSYEQEIAGLAARAEEAREEIRHLSGTATSQDGAVTVTVNGSGSLQDVSFGPRADELPRAQLAAAIMATARQAQAKASREIIDIMTPLIGEDSDAMRFVRDQIPDPAEEDAEEPHDRLAPSNPGGHALNEEELAGPGAGQGAGSGVAPAARRPTRRPAPDSDAGDESFGLDSPLSREETW